MKQFTDTRGRAWNLEITVGTCRRVRNVLGVDLPNITLGEPPLLQRLSTDVILLVDVIYVLVKPQADALSVSDQEFAEAFGGDTASVAADMFWEELIDFFRRDRRPDQAAAIEKQRLLVRSVSRLAEQKILALDVEAMVNQQMPGELSGSSPDSSAATPSSAPSAS